MLQQVISVSAVSFKTKVLPSDPLLSLTNALHILWLLLIAEIIKNENSTFKNILATKWGLYLQGLPTVVEQATL